MDHGYAGARTMGSEFLEYLWGWQITNPAIVRDWVWEEVKAVYMDDRYELQLDEFLEQDHNVHVKANMLAIMLVAIEKGFWQADQETIEELGVNLAQLLIENGLSGSGHPRPGHPMFDWLLPQLPEQFATRLGDLLEITKIHTGSVSVSPPTVIAEIQEVLDLKKEKNNEPTVSSEAVLSRNTLLFSLYIFLFLLFAIGFRQGMSTS